MKSNRIALLVLLLAAVLILAGCIPAAAGTIDQLDPTSSTPGETAPLPAVQLPADTPVSPSDGAASPEEVALGFFSAYVEASQTRRPALDDPELDAQKYLSEDYLLQVAEIKAGFEGAGFDPILQAQAIPPEPIEVKDSQVDGDQATVTLQFGRTVLEQPWERTVSLEKIDGEWKLVPDRLEGGALDPQASVQAFYDWYLAYIGTGEQFRNPLAEQAYRAASYLAPGMVQKVDRMLEDGLPYDPFLCAQDIPAEFTPLASFYNGARPVVVMSSSFTGHYLVADLSRLNFNQWAINNITCGSDPAGYVKAFYTWALDYALGSGEFHNPLMENAY